MTDLLHSLQGRDLGHLRIVAELWGVSLRSAQPNEALSELKAAVLDEHLSAEIIAALTSEARLALMELARAGGRLTWAGFVRQFGDIREIGAARRDREKPYLKPASAAEALFYRGLLARAFFETPDGPQEFAYVPDEWLPVILRDSAGRAGNSAAPPGRPATPAERASPRRANDAILDDATTYLAALRTGHPTRDDPFLQGLLVEAGILARDELQPERARAFLEAPRAEALATLVHAWRASERLNELRLMPGLICEGTWSNQPAAARQFVLNLLEGIPRATWWSLAAFTGDIKTTFPDFQRPAGDYDSWFIKSAADGRFLRGFAAWDEVDGALVRFLIISVMHRLGLLDVAFRRDSQEISAFRMPESGDHEPRRGGPEQGRLQLSSQGTIVARGDVARSVRYQVARFCEWGEERPGEYHYHITPRSLSKAAEQGLKVEQLLTLLANHADAGIPAAMTRALKRWEANGTEVRAETQVVLRVSRPEILQELRKSKAARFLGEPLGPTAVLIKGEAHARVIAALAELGLLAQDDAGSGEQPAAGAGPERSKPGR